MTLSASNADPNKIGHHIDDQDMAPGHSGGGPASKRIVVGFGFWIFLLSDIVMFSAFFATHAVFSETLREGQTPQQLFNLDTVAIETVCLLISSFTCGMASLAMDRRSQLWTQVALFITRFASA